MEIKQYEKLKYMLCDELEKIVDKGGLTAGNLETVNKLADTIKSIGKIEMMEGGEYSEAGGMSYANGGGQGGYSSARGRGRGSNASRDSRGRYSSQGGGSSYGNGGSSYGGGSSYRGGGYSNNDYSYGDAAEHLMGKAEEMLEYADSPEQKKAIESFMKKLENMM